MAGRPKKEDVKETTKTEVEAEVKEDVVKTENATKPKEPVEKVAPKASKRKFEPTETIPCRSVCYGELALEGYKSKILYTWANCGDYADVEYQDLQALQSRKSGFLTQPLFIIEDEDLVEQWGHLLNPIYSKIQEDDIEQILKLSPSQLKKRLKDAPKGIKESIKNMAAAQIMSGELDSLNKIKAIDEVLGIELMSMIK